VHPTLVNDDMRYWRMAPDPRLREHVLCYWMVEEAPRRFKREAFRHGEDLLIPDGHSEIVFNRDTTGFERWRLGARERGAHMRGSYLIGGRSHSVATHASAPVKLAGVKLTPRFLRALIGCPLHVFRDATLSLRDLGDASLLELEEKIALAKSASAVASLLDGFLLEATRRLRDQTSAADALLRKIHRDRGMTAIMRWARDARVDSRTLERSFCSATGMTPKQYARVIRFKRAYAALLAKDSPRRSLSAALDGFYDQSHFNREFRLFTGMAPGAKLSATLPQTMDITDHLLQAELLGPRSSISHAGELTAIT
jgi:AraC-like DNA-binding protein